ncbi:MAG: FKBP-type peptidyl-prolyl cis-trans isomerase [Bacteroidetes bacterium]|nr:MAG: FKBP-type peptidyl-prolyl cis-trans isomerase [Bacteroidota bacterium]
MQTFLALFTVVITITLASCNPSKSYEKEEQNKIQDYLAKNSSLNFELKPSGLYYLEVVKGTGVSPVTGDSAFVRYTGMFLNGTIFNSNVTMGPLYGFVVGDNIAGFDEGILLMAAGGKATLLIPSKLGYGTTGRYPIDGYTPLLFDIELVRVKAASVK